MNEDGNTAVPLVEPLNQECPECHCIGWHGPSCSASESYRRDPEPAEVWCVCGSMRFFDDMLSVARDETEAGRIVLMPYSVVTPENQGSELKAMLDRLHREKIDLSVGIIVVTRGGYIGESTRGEIEYAEKAGKAVRYMHLPARASAAEDPIECDGGPYCSAEQHYDFCSKAVQ